MEAYCNDMDRGGPRETGDEEGTRGKNAGEGLEEGLRLIALVFYVVGVFVVLAVVNTPLVADQDFRGANRVALNAIARPWFRVRDDLRPLVPPAPRRVLRVARGGCGLDLGLRLLLGGLGQLRLRLLRASGVVFRAVFPEQGDDGPCLPGPLCGASPLVYDRELAEYAVVQVPVFVTVSFVSRYVIREVERKEAARRASEEELIEERARDGAQADGRDGWA